MLLADGRIIDKWKMLICLWNCFCRSLSLWCYAFYLRWCKLYSGGLAAKSCPTLSIPWTVACQAPLSMGFSRQEYWSGLSFPSPRDLPYPGIKFRSHVLQADSTDWATREASQYTWYCTNLPDTTWLETGSKRTNISICYSRNVLLHIQNCHCE